LDAEFNQTSGSNNEGRRDMDGPRISLEELFSLVRHSKFPLIKEALDYLPNKEFDNGVVRVRNAVKYYYHIYNII
jgi:hypothetical protein